MSVPRAGYVGVGEVVSAAVRFDQFVVDQHGTQVPLTDVELEAPLMLDEDHNEYVVGIDWTKTVALEEAAKELGFFGNQNTVARPRVQRWHFTVDRLKTLWAVE